MAEYIRLQNSFAAGYLDPILHGLTTSEAYASGLEECTNFIPASSGYLYRRPGTQYEGASFTKSDGTREAMKICSVRTINNPVLVIIREGAINFFRKGQYNVTLTHGVNSNDIPWKEADLPDLDVLEHENKLYIVHKDYPPHIIEAVFSLRFSSARTAATYESIVTVSSEYYLKLDDLKTDSSFKCYKATFINGKFKSGGYYPGCQMIKGGRWYLSGSDFNPGTVYASRAYDANGEERLTDFTLGRYYILYTEATITKTTVYQGHETGASTGDGIEKSVTYTQSSGSGKEIDDVITDVGQIQSIQIPDDNTSIDSTYRYSDEEMKSPTTDTGATKVKVVTTTAKTYTLKTDVESSDAIELTEADMFGSRIQWLLSQQRIIAGTERSIWMDTGVAATPSDFDLNQTLALTVSRVTPVQWGALIIYVPGDRRSVKGFYYDDNAGGYSSIDLSVTGRSLFTADVKRLAVCEGQETVLWVLLENGELLSCTLGNTYGWAHHVLGGNGFVTDITSYYNGSNGSWIYLAVDRNTTDTDHRTTIERLELEDLVNTEVFRLMDCQADVTTLDVGGKLPKESVDELFGGVYSADLGGYAVYNGWPYAVTEEDSYYVYSEGIDEEETWEDKEIQLGYSYTSRAVGLWQELPVNSGQTSLGMKRRTSSMLLQLYRTGDLSCGYQAGKTERLEDLHVLVKANATLGKDPGLYTGIVKISMASGTDEMVHAVVQADKPLPMTILALETKYSLQEV